MAAALFLRDKGARVTVSDSRSAVALSGEIPELLDAGIMVETGGHGLLTFRRQDLIVVSPGVPFDTPELKQVRAFGSAAPPIIGELELATRFLQGQITAITGSNGKTTATSLLGKIFADSRRHTLVGGNIGLPVIELVAQSSAGTMSVLEVSSFQLETVEQFCPHIAVVLNITPDHLDRHGTFENYAAMKTRITENQGAADFLVLNGEDPPTQMLAAKTKAQVFWFSGRRPIKQGAFVHGESVLFIPREGTKAEPILPVAEIRRSGRVDSCFRSQLQGGRAPARICGCSAQRGVLQRLQGDQCGCDEEGVGSISGWGSTHPRRQGQELRLRRVERSAARTVQGCLHNWFSGREDRAATGGSRQDSLSGNAGRGRAQGRGRCGGRRCGAACARMLELRSV
jgi:hypothetical protein